MKLQQYYLGCLAHASYLIADDRTKIAAIVDPQRDVDQYIRDAATSGYQIKYVFLTHFHADFLAGHIELRDRTGAQIYLGARAEAEYQFAAAHDGTKVEFGDVRLEVLETPGHTPEGISILVYDLAKDAAKPQAVLTGDTLFIDDVGRPDLMASIGVTAEELAGELYDSLHGKLMKLPDETLVYPAHGAGSMCGKNLSKDTVSTIGTQRKYNYALAPMSKEEFIRLVTSDQPEAPDYFAYDAMLNRKERGTLEEHLSRELRPLTVDEVVALQSQGAQVVDVREAADYEGAHLRNSLNIGLAGKYATWAGTMLDRSRPVVIIAEPGHEEEAAMRLGRIGLDLTAGYLHGGLAALDKRPDLIARTERITAATLAEQLASTEPPLVLDVRTEKERAAGKIDCSLHIPVNHLRQRLAEVPADRPVVVHCAGGYRSAIACSLLEQAGRSNMIDLVGGYGAWSATGSSCTVGGNCGK
ncbi:MAG: MBL fold metallo-hydrolase [Planctomycetes bacterium]|nr:MBL fold metallo-hydrolase [Planctomycetota bacterium]